MINRFMMLGRMCLVEMWIVFFFVICVVKIYLCVYSVSVVLCVSCVKIGILKILIVMMVLMVFGLKIVVIRIVIKSVGKVKIRLLVCMMILFISDFCFVVV